VCEDANFFVDNPELLDCTFGVQCLSLDHRNDKSRIRGLAPHNFLSSYYLVASVNNAIEVHRVQTMGSQLTFL